MDEGGPDAGRSRVFPGRAWNALPVSVRAVIEGFLVLIAGGAVSGALMFGNLKLAPNLPVFLPATVLWLWMFWRYLGGRGWPRATSLHRRDALGLRTLAPRVWRWSLVAGGCGVTCAVGIAFVTYRLAPLPPAAYQAPFDVSSLPPLTLAAMFTAIALTAGVVEEMGFRGYMLLPIASRHGWLVGIGVVTVLFHISHLSHAYATLAFAPFFLVHGLVFGALVFHTRSVLPGVVLHALSDIIVLPMQYGVIPSAGRWEFVGQGWLALMAGVAALFAFRHLGRVVAHERRVATT